MASPDEIHFSGEIMRLIFMAILLAAIGTGQTWAKSPPSGSGNVEQARSHLSNGTQMTFGPGHGTQVEFMQQDGAAFLFYPGNTRIVPGQWKLEQLAGGSVALCFKYGANTYNPVTRQSGAGWDCEDIARYKAGVVDSAGGDVLGLARQTSVPFALPRERTTITRLRKGVASIASAAAAPKLSVPGQCAAILKNANTSRSAMTQAGLLYYHGMQMGQSCVPVDYVQAFRLLRKAGDSRNFASLLADLKLKAASGNPKAAAALPRIDVSPVK
jgi:hypothetical protein